MYDEPQAAFQVLDVSHANSFSNQAGHAVAPFVVEAFDDAGAAAALVAGSVLPGREAFGIGFIEIGVSQLAPMSCGDAKPHLSPGLRASVADLPGQHFARQARNCEPQVFVASLEAIADHQFVQLQNLAVTSGQQRVGETQARLFRLFLSSSRTVVRATLKVRAIARWLSLSCKAATINASFSADKARVLGLGVQLLRQSRHFKRCEPPRLKPKRITPSLKPQCGHKNVEETMHNI